MNRILPFLPRQDQPFPLWCDVVHFEAGGEHHTVIIRGWDIGQVVRCRLCPNHACVANEADVCTIRVNRDVPDEKTWTFVRPADGSLANRGGGGNIG